MRLKVWILGLLMVFMGASGTFAYESNLRPFPDVVPNDWANDPIYSLSVTGTIKGYPDATFRPDGQLTREAFIHLLVQATKLTAEGQGAVQLQDVASHRWSYESISKAYRAGLIDFMIEQERLMPAQPITREEVASLVGKYLLSQQSSEGQKQWLDHEWMQEMKANPFLDQAEIEEALKPFVFNSVKHDIIAGDLAGTFRPHDVLKRKEAAAIIYRLINKQIEDNPIEMLGFYAIRSYPQIDKLAQLDQVALAWSELKYEGQGKAGLDLVSGFYKIPEGSQEVIELAESHSLKRDLMIFNNNEANLMPFLQDEQAIDSFISDLTEALSDPNYGFTGVTIDLENLKSEQSRKPLVEFVAKVKEAIGDKTLTVAVPPTVYYKGYDIKGLAEQADFMVLMAYDFTHGPSVLPSAPLPLVNETIVEFLKLVPKEKLILGISKQANQWTTEESGTVHFEPQAGIEKVEGKRKEAGVSNTVSVPFFLSKIEFADSRGQHLVWYEDTASIQKKLWLARYYGLHGVSLWHMGNFTDEDWAMLKKERVLSPTP